MQMQRAQMGCQHRPHEEHDVPEGQPSGIPNPEDADYGPQLGMLLQRCPRSSPSALVLHADDAVEVLAAAVEPVPADQRALPERIDVI